MEIGYSAFFVPEKVNERFVDNVIAELPHSDRFMKMAAWQIILLRYRFFSHILLQASHSIRLSLATNAYELFY